MELGGFMKEILNIVVTGGPCGGKTTALDELTKLLRGYGYTVYLVSEVATELINDGIKPFGENKIPLLEFQSLIFDSQYNKETIRRNAALKCPNEKVAILYDRGILDNRAYISNLEFQNIIKERNVNEADIIKRYDLVIHLVTAAIGKDEYYTTLNNSARTETKEEARMMDKKTMEAWQNHPNLKIVSNDTLFDEKIEKVKNIIRAYIGEEEVIKHERYLIKPNDILWEKFSNNAIKEEIEEFVLQYDNVCDVVFQKSTINNSSYYTCLKNKYEDSGLKTTICKSINESTYLDNLSMVKGILLKKIRYNFIDDGERYRMDLYNLDGDTFIILERDVTNISRKNVPYFIKNYLDITNERDYNDDSIYIDYNIRKIMEKEKVIK